jgi:argininosuccinate lyase
VRAAGESNLQLDEMPLEAYEAIGPFDADVFQVFDALKSVEKRNGIGGTSPQSVKKQLAGIRRLLSLEKS